MKKFLITFFVTLLCAMAIFCIGVSAETYGDLTYRILNDEITITECDPSATGEIVIPENLDGYPQLLVNLHLNDAPDLNR